MVVNLSHVWNTSIQYKSPEREKVIILAYIYFYNVYIWRQFKILWFFFYFLYFIIVFSD